MSLATLLHLSPLRGEMQDHAFSFEHNMAHRGLLGSMSPLTRFSVIPYVLSPGFNHGMWHQDHQQAHSDFQYGLHGWYGETVGFLGPGYNIQDYDLRQQEQREWWTFQNHYAHLDAISTQSSTDLVWPFF